MQQVILYSTNNESGNKLQAVIEALTPADSLELHRTIEDLGRRLQKLQAGRHRTIVVLHAADRTQLSHLSRIKDCFEDLRLILVLPDREKDTVREGLAMYPRFIAYADSDFAAFITVLNKMLQADRPQPAAWEAGGRAECC